MRYMCGFLCVLAVACGTLTMAVSHARPVGPVSGLSASAPDQRRQAVDAVRQWRREVVGHLCGMVEARASTDAEVEQKREAILVLGQLKATEAVPVLVDNIELAVNGPFPVEGFEATLGYPGRPCIRALADIGIPSIERIIGNLGKEPLGDRRLRMYAAVIRLVDGDENAVLRVQVALKTAKGQRRESLARLLELVKERGIIKKVDLIKKH